MIAETKGIILRQTKIAGGRKIMLLFSEKYGKISIGAAATERSKSKSSLALRPFTYGRYDLYKTRDNYYINSAEVLKSYYKIGEDLDKYVQCAYILELTEKLLPEEQPAQATFYLLLDFFGLMETRQSRYDTLALAYQVKLLKLMGVMPALDGCIRCNCKDESKKFVFSIKEGGLLCADCARDTEAASEFQGIPQPRQNSEFPQNNRPQQPFKSQHSPCAKQKVENPEKHSLIYSVDFGIVNILNYFSLHPLRELEHLALETARQQAIQQMIRSYMAYHLDIGSLKSEIFLASEQP